jgi:hypothetical protein
MIGSTVDLGMFISSERLWAECGVDTEWMAGYETRDIVLHGMA